MAVKRSARSLDSVFRRLRELERSLDALQKHEARQVEALEGHQTVDAEDAMALSFNKIRGHICSIEETLKAIAEATGEVPKR